MIDFALEKLKERCGVTERDVGDYREVKKSGMHFIIHAYDVPGIGNMSTVRMNAMLGLMKMDTVVFTPLTKDAPFFSYDLIDVLGKQTLLIELYDTCLQPCDLSGLQAVKDRAAALPDTKLEPHWYDHLRLPPSLAKKGKKLGDAFEKLLEEYFTEYLKLMDTVPACPEAEKRAKVAAYVDGLFSNGGPATDQFKKLIGEDAAKELFSRFIFASKA